MSRSVTGVLKWLCEYIIPTLFCFVFSDLRLNCGIEFYVLILLLVYNLYEIGYIQNDTETVKNELKPTLRLNVDERNYYESHIFPIYGLRLFVSILISILILFLSDYSKGSFVVVSGSWTILITYLFYNSVRGKISFLLHFFLLFLRYSAFLFIFFPHIPCDIFLLSVLIFPLPTMMEIIRKGKFDVQFNFSKIYLKNYDNRYSFRVKYYFILTILTIVFSITGYSSSTLILLPLYFLGYRIVFILLNKSKSPNNP